MGAGDSFGEQALYDDSSRGATISAEGDVIIKIGVLHYLNMGFD